MCIRDRHRELHHSSQVMEDEMKQKTISLENIGVAALFIVGFFAMAALWAHWADECDDGQLSSCALLVGSL